MHETGCSGLVHWDDREGWDGEEGGRRDSGWGTHVNPWLTHVNGQQKPLKNNLKKKYAKSVLYVCVSIPAL